MKVSQRAGKDSTQVEWYDTECRKVKKEKFKFLNLFAKTGYQYFYEKFRFPRNKFKHLIRSKAEDYKTSSREQIENSVNDQKGFWILVKEVSRNSFTSSKIPAETFFLFCRSLINACGLLFVWCFALVSYRCIFNFVMHSKKQTGP